MNFDWMFEDQELETTRTLNKSAVHIRRSSAREMQIHLAKKTAAKDILTRLPDSGETWHVVSNGAYDFWTWIPVLIEMMQGVDLCTLSTWTINRTNVVELFDLFDTGQIKQILMLTGTYFKRRESSVYATLLTGMQERKQRYIAFDNHTKISLLRNAKHSIVIEGSANLTSNPRLEQYTMTNDAALLDFHLGWIREILADGTI